ncbi:UPF0758 domain-containing protein [Candidatus Omnitrophota bacterium]
MNNSESLYLKKIRRRLRQYGEHSLNAEELIALLIGSGVKRCDVFSLAIAIIKKFKTFRNMLDAPRIQWREFKGLGEVKLSQIKAALEIGRRLHGFEQIDSATQILSSGDAVTLLMPRIVGLKREVFHGIFLDAQHRVIEIIKLTEGTVNN